MMTEHELAVIGGGLIGASIAWGARRAGADVVLLDEGDVAFRASRGNFGLIWLQGKGVGAPHYMRLSLHAGDLWERFAGELAETSGIDVAWRRCGGMHFCFGEDELGARRDVIAATRAQGGAITIEILDRDALRRLLPGIGDAVAGASFSPADSVVNPLRLLRALHRAFETGGGRYRPGAKVLRLSETSGGFEIAGDGFSLSAARVALAAGLGNVALGAMIGLPLPLRPERGQILVTERVAPFLPFVGNCVQQTVEGTVLIGSSHEEAGFSEDTGVVSGARLARQAIRVFPALAAATLVRHWAGLRIMSPDGLPIYEESPIAPGAFAVTCHSGVTLASVHGLEIGPALAAGALPEILAPFGSDRFHVPAH